MSNIVNVIDVESTCWEKKWEQPRNEISEIIEIGICEVDINKMEILNTDSIIVKPAMSKVSKFCTKLTTLTQEDVNKGISFGDACAILMNRHESSDRTFISWGDYDRKQFQNNCKDYTVKYPFGPRHLNLKNTFSLFHGLDRELGMDAALERLKMPLEGTHHRGSWDSKNIAKILIHMIKKFRQ